MNEETDREEQVRLLTEKLHDRIRVRKHPSGVESHVLDLRGRRWGDLGPMTIRIKTHPDWPKEGQPVESREAAEAQLKRYAEWLQERLASHSSRRTRKVLIWSDAVPEFLADLASKGKDSSTYKNYRLIFQNRVIPKWGDHPLTLSSEQVGEWLDTVQVVKRVNGGSLKN
jgi:hypothetical protein